MKVAFLDRDGVLNLKRDDVYYVTELEQLQLAPGAGEAVAALNAAGYRVMVATNQRAVARGMLSLEGLAAIHHKLALSISALGGTIDRFFVCPHSDGECDCRKPLPGLFSQAFREHPEIDRRASFFVGDSDTDRQAAEAAGLRFIPLETNADLLACMRAQQIVA